MNDSEKKSERKRKWIKRMKKTEQIKTMENYKAGNKTLFSFISNAIVIVREDWFSKEISHGR